MEIVDGFTAMKLVKASLKFHTLKGYRSVTCLEGTASHACQSDYSHHNRASWTPSTHRAMSRWKSSVNLASYWMDDNKIGKELNGLIAIEVLRLKQN